RASEAKAEVKLGELANADFAWKGTAERPVVRRELREARRKSMLSVTRTGEASPREKYVETAYWNPSVVTDKEGKARMSFKAPNALSEYRITARGVTGSDTLAGQTTAALIVKKDFFVDLKVPSSLTQGDKPRFI